MKPSVFFVKVLRKVYRKFFSKTVNNRVEHPEMFDPQYASDHIYSLLASDKPCMIARFGSTELSCLLNYMSVKSHKHQYIKYIKGEVSDWWWNEKYMGYMKNNAGFFPVDEEHLSRFGELMIEDIKQLDLLGSWIPEEEKIALGENNSIVKVRLLLLEPYWGTQPWTRALKGKKVLVVHPFAPLIEKQYREHRKKLFENPDVLPAFELQTIQAVQSIGGETNGFHDWFEALQWMKDEIDKRDYDIALIGCGAYGFPLAAYVKRQGKKAVHLAGALQLLFGIKGKRWETPNYSADYNYTQLFNDYWVSPDASLKPKNADQVEGACYW